MWRMALVVALVGCGSSGGAKVPQSGKSVQAVCPQAFNAPGFPIDLIGNEIAPGCPTRPFVSSDPVCARDGRCPTPCHSTLFMGPMERTATYAYDDAGHIVSVDAGGYQATCTYDKAGVAQCTADGSGTIKVARDDKGRIASATGKAGTWQFTYNAHGDLATFIAPASDEGDAASWKLDYDAKHRLVGETNGTAHATYRYDDRGQMVERIVDGEHGQHQTFTYDTAGRLASMTAVYGPNTFETTFSYDDKGRLVESSATGGGNAAASGVRLAYDCK